jgi:hypothetical protein
MRRVQRTIRLHPDLDKELQVKATGDVSVTEIIEGALSRHFRREAVDVQIEHLTRKQGKMTESIDKLGEHQLKLQKTLDSIATHRQVTSFSPRSSSHWAASTASSLLTAGRWRRLSRRRSPTPTDRRPCVTSCTATGQPQTSGNRRT